jgi:hypothetical protein
MEQNARPTMLPGSSSKIQLRQNVKEYWIKKITVRNRRAGKLIVDNPDKK